MRLQQVVELIQRVLYISMVQQINIMDVMAQHGTHFIKYCKEVKMKKQIIILALITISLFGIFIVNAGLFGDLFGGDMKAKETSINMNTNELNFLKEKARITVCD